MQGEPLFLAPRRIIDINFSPGIPLGTKVSNYAKGSVGPAQKEARSRLADLGKTDWRSRWYGVSYDEAEAAYGSIPDTMSDERLWSIQDIPTPAEMTLVETFYDHWREVLSNDTWTASDISVILPGTPELNIVPEENSESGKLEKPRRRARTKQVLQEKDRRSPESEDEDDSEKVTGRDEEEVETRNRKGKGVARYPVARQRGGSDDDMEVDGGAPPSRDRFLQQERGTSKKDALFEVPTRVTGKGLKSLVPAHTNKSIAPPFVDEDMQVDAEQSQHGTDLVQPSPPRTPRHTPARNVITFLSPIQRELNRPGTSLTQRTAGILNAEVGC